jgi:hypothetical protein
MRYITLILLGLVTSLCGQALLLDIQVQLSKKEYVPYEAIDATVFVKNNSAQQLRLHNQSGRNWLEFVINRSGITDVNMAQNALFADAVIPPNQTIKRTVTISSLFPLTTQGNYTIRAQINPPASTGIAKSRSEPFFFDVIGAVSIFSKQVGVSALKGKVFKYDISILNKASGNEIYFQSFEGNDSIPLTTRSLGGFVNINRPAIVIEQSGLINILYQLDSKLFRFLKIDPYGKILVQELHRRTDVGIPILVERKETKQVGVGNSMTFDAEKERKAKLAIHNISERPPFAY